MWDDEAGAISALNLIRSSNEAVAEMDKKAMTFLFANGKVELVVRNLLARKLVENPEISNEYLVVREWNKHDLVLLKDGRPEMILEGKAWIHADAIHPSKLDKGQAEIKNAFEKDLQKIRDTQKNHPGARGFISIIFSSIDTSRCSEQDAQLVGYPSLHKAGIKQAGSFEELHGLGRSLATRFLQEREEVGDIKREIMFTGNYLGMDLWVDIFVIEILPN